MPMIYRTGNADWISLHNTDPLPPVIRAYDEAENELVSISAPERIPNTFVDTLNYSGGTSDALCYQAYTIKGEAGYFAQSGNANGTPSGIFYPYKCTVRQDGWIFAPCEPLRWSNQYNYSTKWRIYGSGCLEWLRVYRRNGDRVDFPQLHGAVIGDIAFNDDETIIVGGSEYLNSGSNLRKYSADGATLIWSNTVAEWAGFNQIIEQIMIDDGDIYVRGQANEDRYWPSYGYYGFIAKYNASGVRQWEHRFTNRDQSSDRVFSILLLDGYLYTSVYELVGGNWTTVQKRDLADGTVLASHTNDFTLTTPSYWLTNKGASLYGGKSISEFWIEPDDWNIREFDPDTLSVLSSEHVAGSSWSPANGANFLYDAADEVWFSAIQGDIASWEFMPRVQIVLDTQTPSIALPLALALFTWVGDTYTTPDGIPLGMGLAVPLQRREYVGALRLPDIYRCTLSGDPDIELPLSSFTIRRDTGGVSLSVVVPASSAALVAAAVARSDGILTLLRGVRFQDGTDQIEPMLVVPLDGGVRYDIGTQSASLTLSGQTVEIADRDPETRTLKGISYRSESGGSRRVRCALDTYLRPGDTADLGGGETLTVADLTYSVNARQGTMEVAE